MKPVLLAMLIGIGTSVVLWLSTVHLLSFAGTIKAWTARRRRLAIALAILIPLTPIIGTAAGLNAVHAALSEAGETVGQHGGGWPSDLSLVADESLRTSIGAFMAVSALLALLMGAVLVLLTVKHFDHVTRVAYALFSATGVATGLGLIALVTASIIIWPTALPWMIGAQAVLNLFLAFLAFLLTWFSHLYRRTGVPVTMIVIAASFLFSALGWNDNHQVEYTTNTGPVRDFGPSARDWLISRADRQFYIDLKKPYPVYIVAAEGGGMYAGYHAASWLSAMQDLCPSFAQHTFAISSVSGGSLGAAVFATRARQLARNEEHHYCNAGFRLFRIGAESFFSQELLSPLLAAALFPDLLQRLLPLPFRALDRARALEAAFAVAWDNSYVRDEPMRGDSAGERIEPQYWSGHFTDGLNSTWRPEGAAPALFLNTTNMQTGSRVTIGPIKFRQTATAQHISDAVCAGPRSVDLSLATAVSLSARFPWLTPPGWFEIRDASPPCGTRTGRGRVYLADGGYFENSGLETAIEIAGFFEELFSPNGQAPSPSLKSEFPYGIDVKIIMIFSSDRALSEPPDVAVAHAGEILAPIQTLLATRTARTRAVHLRTVLERSQGFNTESNKPVQRYTISGSGIVRQGIDDVHQVALDRSRFNLPLGWSLSIRSIEYIGQNADAAAKLALDLVASELTGDSTDDLKKRPSK